MKNLYITLIAAFILIATGNVQAKTHFIHTDHLGTPLAMTDSTQAVTWQAEYTPFGEAIIDPASTAELNLRFPGQYYDEETGLHYNYFREYDPETGRYVQSDPIGLVAGPNTYAYVHGNPLRYIDPLGLAACDCKTADCPFIQPYDSDPMWRRAGGGWLFHCGFTVIQENRDPTPECPAAECVYKDRRLIDPNGFYGDCAGTPDQYPVSDPINKYFWHFLVDSDGPASNWNALRRSLSHHLSPISQPSRF